MAATTRGKITLLLAEKGPQNASKDNWRYDWRTIGIEPPPHGVIGEIIGAPVQIEQKINVPNNQ